MTSAFVLRSMSVTSSGRASISRMISFTSGLFSEMLLAIICMRTVLPVRGGATIRPRWPLPMGVSRSMTRILTLFLLLVSSTRRSFGNSGVRFSNGTLPRCPSGGPSLMLLTFCSAKKRSLSFGERISPSTMSPVRRAKRRTCEGET